jgi:hypothetical protein
MCNLEKIISLPPETEIIKAYKGEECDELSIEPGGELSTPCSSPKCYGDFSFIEDAKGRYKCSNCGRFVGRETAPSCKLCWDNGDGDLAQLVDAFICPICKQLLELIDDDDEFYDRHCKYSHRWLNLVEKKGIHA